VIRIRFGGAAIVLLAAGAIAEAATAQEFSIRWLSPSAFPQVPQVIRRALESRGCVIPQFRFPHNPNRVHNVIRGSFARRGQVDWAVLCSRQGRSSIMIFWGGPVRCPPMLFHVAVPDPQRPGSVRIVQSAETRGTLQIIRVGRDYILERNRRYGPIDPLPPVIDHHGIDIWNPGSTASVVSYCYKGRWLRLMGAD